ncbi:hypothetical protein [Parafrankia discariae]|uniref:hypothetical protein n=1 Tax=Parafrankia discariae TaxID=365528 RepID=UPI00036AEFBF|nr:hypothetical protein [Parafrankia discariae]
MLAAGWFDTFNKLTGQVKALVFVVLGIVVVINIIRVAFSRQGALVPLLMAAVAGAVAIWAANNSDDNANRLKEDLDNASGIHLVVPAADIRLWEDAGRVGV